MNSLRRSRRRGFAAALAAFVGLCLLASWILGPMGASKPDEPEADQGAAASDRTKPTLALHADPRHVDSSPAGSLPASESAVSIDSRVVIEAGGWQEGMHLVGFVSVRYPGDDAQTLRQGIAAGRAEIRVPDDLFGEEHELPIAVGLAGRGVKKVVSWRVLKRGSTLRVPLDVDRGLRLAGRVVSTDGVPVPGIDIVARFQPSYGGLKLGSSYATADLIYSAAAFSEGRATTDTDGQFEILGLRERKYNLTTADLTWGFIPAKRPGLRPPQEGVKLIATQTYRVHVRVVNAQNGEPVPASRFRFTVGGRMHTGFGCREAPVTLALTPTGRAMREGRDVKIVARVKAFGFKSTETTWFFPSGTRVVEDEVRLEPVPVYTRHFVLRGADGNPSSGAYAAAITNDSGRHTFLLEAGDTPGSFSCRVPAGSWRCHVFPRGAIYHKLLSWEGLVGGVEEPSMPVDVDLPRFGELEVSGWEEGSIVLRFTVERTRITTVAWSKTHRYVFPEGTWPYVAKIDGKVVQEGEIEIRGGQSHTLVIERD